MQIKRQFTPRAVADNDFFVFDFGDPSAVNDFGDEGEALAEGETIAASPAPTVTASLNPYYASQPEAPGALAVVGASIQDGPIMPSSRVMTNVQPSGTANAEYLLTCTVTTSTGRKIGRSARLLTTLL